MPSAQPRERNSDAQREDIHKILIIGSGPIIIGQACEFDYSGTQACKALRALGYQVVLVNSNPATIMTDPGTADVTYIEPLNAKVLTEIIAQERPDALLPNLGGQTGLNLASELHRLGVLEKYGVKVIGVSVDAISGAKTAWPSRRPWTGWGSKCPAAKPSPASRMPKQVADELGYPVVLRPAYTMGGTGGGLVYNVEELRTVASRGLAASLVDQVLVEESVLGWEELELEVVRDAKNQMITVCFIENVDAMGVHTGDSFCTAPMLTIDPALQKRLQEQSYAIVEAIEVIGGTNIQFAHDPPDGRVVVIEINPRTSRSSALASKATGFPIARVSSLLAGGLTLDEIPYWRDGTLEKYTPSGDYVVVKFARWAFEKFTGVQDQLGTQMRAVGEVMSIGKTYKEALQKAIRSLEINRYGLGFAKNFNALPLEALYNALGAPSSERHFQMYEALRKGADVEKLHALTHIKRWFIEQMQELVVLEEEILRLPGQPAAGRAADAGQAGRLCRPLPGPPAGLRGNRDPRAAPGPGRGPSLGGGAGQRRGERRLLLLHLQRHGPRGGERATQDHGPGRRPQPHRPGDRVRLLLRPCGLCDPRSRLRVDHGQLQPRDGLHRLRHLGQALFRAADRRGRAEHLREGKTRGGDRAVRRPDPAQHRRRAGGGRGQRCWAPPRTPSIWPKTATASARSCANWAFPSRNRAWPAPWKRRAPIAAEIGYPLMVRPSYVLGGRGMEVVQDEEMLQQYVQAAVEVSPERPILIDRFLDNAIEAEADAIADGTEAFVPAVMEHIELAGIHSGDSACVIPPISIAPRHIDTISEYTRKIAMALNVVGLMNMQYAISEDTVYVLEANPRASRTVPIVSKVCNISMARLATQVMLGSKIADLALTPRLISHYGVKEAVFPFNMFPEVDPILGPEMRSTGEVLGLSHSFGRAFFKAQEATQVTLPLAGTVLFTIADRDKKAALEPVRLFRDLGFRILATPGTPFVPEGKRNRDRTGPEARLRAPGPGGRHQKRRGAAAGQHPQRPPEHPAQLRGPPGRHQVQDPLHHHHRRRDCSRQRDRRAPPGRPQGAPAAGLSESVRVIFKRWSAAT